MVNTCTDAFCNNQSSVGVLLGNGDGTFQPVVAYATGGIYAQSVAAGDVNGDGKLDLVVSNSYTDASRSGSSVGILLGNGDGTFQPVVTYASGGLPAYSLTIGDVNGDGKLDVVVANQCAITGCPGGSVSVLLGNGDGTLRPAVTYASGGNYAQSVVVADVNGDGKPDVVVANQECMTGCGGAGEVSVLLGKGDGTFLPAVTYGSGGQGVQSLVVGDLNGDGKLDLVLESLCIDNTCQVGGVDVLLGNGDGTFQPAVTYPSGGRDAQSLAIGDVNGDGKLDLVAFNAGSGASNLGVLLGNGDGTFQSALIANSGSGNTNFVTVADVNGDGKPDLLVADTAGLAGVLINIFNEPLAQLYPASLFFTNQAVGTSSSTQSVSLSNPGNTILSISNIATTGDFGQVNNCGGSLAAGGSCTIQVTFTPTVTGTLTGSITVTDNAKNSPQSIALTGLGGIAVGSVSPGSLSYTTQLVGTTSAAQRVVLKNTGNGPMVVSSVGMTGDFAIQSNFCLKGVKPNTHCDVFVTFTPTGVGARTGMLTFNDSANNSPQSVSLIGVGTTTTTTSVISSPATSTYGKPVKLLAAVIPASPGAPTGTVRFYSNGTSLGTATVQVGVAALTTSALHAGSDAITASYGGDTLFGASVSPAVTEPVKQATSKTTLTSNLNPSHVNQSVTFTANVISQFAGTVTGTVTFKQGATVLGTSTIAGGTATLAHTFTKAATVTITALYSGDPNSKKSSSAAVKQVITP